MHRYIAKESHGIVHNKQKAIFVNDIDDDFFHTASSTKSSPHYQSLKRLDELIATSGLICMD